MRLRSSLPETVGAVTRECHPVDPYAGAVSEDGVGSDHSGGAARDQLGGRSRFIPAVLNDLCLSDDGPFGGQESKRLAG